MSNCECGKQLLDYVSIAGRICPHCEKWIPPTKKLAMVVDNQQKKKLIEIKVRESIHKKLGLNGETKCQ